MSKKLLDIRKKIDRLDQTIQEALIQRAALVDDIRDEKIKKGLPFVQPAREAEMIRSLLARHEGNLPQAAIVRIWRELVGAIALMQTGMRVSVCVEGENFITWDLAKSYFGSVVSMQRFSSPSVALASVREDESSFTVLPWPKDDKPFPWWVNLFDHDTDMGIVAALPFGYVEGQLNDENSKALVVSKTAFSPSSHDRSFLVMRLDMHVSRARIVDQLRHFGMEPVSIITKKPEGEEGDSLHFIEIEGYLIGDDERLVHLAESFEEHEVIVKAVGGYPVSPVFDRATSLQYEEPILRAPKASK